MTEYDLSMYQRPSRYAEADKFYGFAPTEFGNYIDSATLLEKVSLWVAVPIASGTAQWVRGMSILNPSDGETA